MTKTKIIVTIRELVTITIVAVIMMIYRRNNMEKKKLDLIKKLGR